MTKQAPEGQGRPMYTNCVCVFKIEKFPCWMSLEAAQHLLNWRSNSYFFSLKSTARYLHRNQSLLKSYSAFSSPSLPAVAGLWPGRPPFKEELTSRMCRGPRVSSELLGTTSMVLYPPLSLRSGCYHHF